MPFESQAQRRFMYAKDPKMARRFEKKTPKNKKLPERKGKPIRKYYMNKSDGAHMMSAFDSAWLVLKAPIDEQGNFVHDSAPSEESMSDNRGTLGDLPNMGANLRLSDLADLPVELAQKIIDHHFPKEEEVRAPPMPFYSSTDRGYDPEREMSMGETMGFAKPVKVNKPMPQAQRRDMIEEEEKDAE